MFTQWVNSGIVVTVIILSFHLGSICTFYSTSLYGNLADCPSNVEHHLGFL